MNLEQFLTKFINQEQIDCFNYKTGLCFNIIKFCSYNDRELFISTFISWSKFSGSERFPIYDQGQTLFEKLKRFIFDYNDTPHSQYNIENLYKGNQLKLRIELAKHALKELYGIQL